MNKATIAVLVVAIAMIGFLTFRHQQQKEQKEADKATPVTIDGYLPPPLQAEWQKRKESPLLFLSEKEDDRKKKFKVAPFDEVQLTYKGMSATVKRKSAAEGKEEEWELTSPVASEVEKYRIKNMIETFAIDTSLTPVGEAGSEAELRRFGLDPKRAIQVALKEGGVTKVNLVVGNRKKLEKGDEGGGVDTYDTFVMLPDNPKHVYRARHKDLRSPFELELGELRSKKVFAFDIADISKVTIENPKAEDGPKKIVLAATWKEKVEEKKEGEEPKPEGKDDKKDEKKEMEGTWTLAEPKIPDFQLAKQRTFWSSIANLRASEYVMGEAPGEDTGLVGPDLARITIELTAPEPKTIVIAFGGVKEKNRSVYARIEGRNEYMIVSDQTRKNMLKDLNELRDKTILGAEKDEQVTRIRIQNEKTAGKPMVLERVGSEWKMTEPLNPNPYAKEVKALVSGIRYFRATDFLTTAPDLAQSGLDKPTITLTATVDGVDKTILFGLEKDSKVTCRLADKEIYFTVGSWTKKKFEKGPTDFQNKALIAVDPALVTKLELRHSDETVKLERIDGTHWKMTAPEPLDEAGGLKDSVVNGIANTLKSFEVKSFSDKAPGEVGLGNPAFILVATLGDATTREIRVSDKTEDDAHYILIESPEATPSAVYTVDKYKVKNLRKKLADLKK